MPSATLRDGSRVQLAAGLPATLSGLADRLTAETLTGSAVPLADATVRCADGSLLRFGEIVAVEEDA